MTVNGIATHIVEIGDKGKPPVLLLHGYPENSAEFEMVMDLLKNDYYLVAVDLPGIGGTESIASSPWEEVKRNPHIWHFAFFSVPGLPEQLISRKQRILFDYFCDTISADGHAINVEKRERYTAAYSSSEALRTSLEWYRSFPEDEAGNARTLLVIRQYCT